MKIKEIKLYNFKRFTDTTISEIPITARLVMLVGPNGCGKTSIIDAAYMWQRQRYSRNQNWNETYHRKQIPGVTTSWDNSVSILFHDPQPSNAEQQKKAIYVRSAYRNDPEFEFGSLSRVGPAVEEFRINHLIDNDLAVRQNYQRLVSQGFEDIYERAQPDMTIGQFREQSIGEIRTVMERLFPGLVLNSLGNPLSAGTFKFDKGDSRAFLYKNLSGGEKAVFDLILDILIKRREYNDTVFFIDEPEAHLSPILQSGLINELYNLIPETSQLWLATHSIGIIRKARELNRINPGSVVFLDFDGVNFDLPIIVNPTEPNRAFWKRAMEIALDEIAGFVTPEVIVLCEGGRIGGGAEFDAECYNEIFKMEFPDVIFIGAGNVEDIKNDPKGVGRLISALSSSIKLIRIIDRDERTDEEIRELKEKQINVLSRRTIESFLLDDEIISAICTSYGRPELNTQLINAKAESIQNSINSGFPKDDMKHPSGEIYLAAKKLFPDRKLGSDNRAFMKGICAPLIKPGTNVYELLKKDIFG